MTERERPIYVGGGRASLLVRRGERDRFRLVVPQGEGHHGKSLGDVSRQQARGLLRWGRRHGGNRVGRMG